MKHFSQMCCEKVDFFLLYRIFRLLSSYSSHLFTISLSAQGTPFGCPFRGAFFRKSSTPTNASPERGDSPRGGEMSRRDRGDRSVRGGPPPGGGGVSHAESFLNHPIQHPSITRTSCAFGCAPITVCTRAPPSKKQNVGMLEMPNCTASACCSSTFTL